MPWKPWKYREDLEKQTTTRAGGSQWRFCEKEDWRGLGESGGTFTEALSWHLPGVVRMNYWWGRCWEAIVVSWWVELTCAKPKCPQGQWCPNSSSTARLRSSGASRTLCARNPGASVAKTGPHKTGCRTKAQTWVWVIVQRALNVTEGVKT